METGLLSFVLSHFLDGAFASAAANAARKSIQAAIVPVWCAMQKKKPAGMSGGPKAIASIGDQSGLKKVKKSNRSPIAGLLSGT
jgi:hypothetical protein